MLKELWQYRRFIIAAVKREFHSQYSKSLLGSAWIIMNPLYMCIIYTSIFASIMHGSDHRLSYTIYVAAGLLAWNFFTDVFNRSQSLYQNYALILKKHPFPLLCLPVIVILIAWFDFLVSFGLFTGYLVFTGAFPGWCYLAIVPIVCLHTAFAIGLAAGLGLLNLFFRDIEKLLVVVLQIWFWMTPIVYFMDALPAKTQSLLSLNPLTAIIGAYQTVLARQQWPEWHSLLFPFLLTLGSGVLFLRFYRKRLVDILDEL